MSTTKIASNQLADTYLKSTDTITLKNKLTINGTEYDGSTAQTITISGGSSYSNGSGISISNNTINHSNIIDSGVLGDNSGTTTTGSSISIPYASYDSNGHIVSKGTHTHTITLSDLDGASSDHTHSYLPLSGGTLTGNLTGTSITSTNITSSYIDKINTITDASGSVTVNCSLGNYVIFNISGNVTGFTFSNAGTSGSTSRMLLLQYTFDSTSYTITWPSNVKWDSNGAIESDTSSGSVNLVTLITNDGGTTWYASGKTYSDS